MTISSVASDKPEYVGKDLEAMSFADNYHRWIMAELAPYVGAIAAEIGAGCGNFTRLILETKVKELISYEPSADMFKLLKESVGDEKRVKVVNEYFCPSVPHKFDSIFYINVLEHIGDDASELVTVHSKLNQNGHALIFVPALPALFSDLDKQVGHFRRYRKEGLADLIETVGFSIVKIKYFDIAGIIPWYINFVLLKNKMSSGSVSVYDKTVIPFMRIIETLFTPPIGKNILLVARKTTD